MNSAQAGESEQAVASSEPACYSRKQDQTRRAFGFQWSMREAFESDAVQAKTRSWLYERYCGGEPNVLSNWLAGGRKHILDAGCGAALSAIQFFGEHLRQHDYLGVDIAGDAVAVARDRFAERGLPGRFLCRSILDLPVPDHSLDLIFSEGVLHHTDDTHASFRYLAKKLRTGGRFLFYVYAKKAVLREFTDDHIRQAIAPLDDEAAWEALKPLTKLGAVLGSLNTDIEVPEDIPYLGIRAGTYDLQRFFYWNICKAFHRPDFTLDEMNHINFDWFRPLNCHRHTPEEVTGWCEEDGFTIERFDVQEAGITVVARKGT